MKLVFVADDLGYCPKRSRGIFELLESRARVSSFLFENSRGVRTKSDFVQKTDLVLKPIASKNGFRTKTDFIRFCFSYEIYFLYDICFGTISVFLYEIRFRTKSVLLRNPSCYEIRFGAKLISFDRDKKDLESVTDGQRKEILG
jgi:hypothetical protein